MIHRRKTHLLIPLLALSVTLATTASVRAQERQYQGSVGTSTSLQVTFGSTPHWAPITGTRVEEIPQAERPDYDMFRYDGNYYAYNNNRWYMSRADRGAFNMIDNRSVPSELSRVPRDHWRNYPSGWVATNGDSPYRESGRTSGSLRVSFDSSPHWSSIRGTRVEEIQQAERPDYDMFRYDGSYYAYDNDQWYMSRSDRGDFDMIDVGSVPSELSRVPREHWRNYPSGWGDGSGNPRYQDSQGMPSSLQIDFGSGRRWAGIHGTRVRELRGGDRPEYDVFRYGGRYYVYHYNRWYMSRRPMGTFMAIDQRFVPYELSRVPRDHWRNYPADWASRNDDPRDRRRARRY